jgi:enoyl-CoA hydratase
MPSELVHVEETEAGIYRITLSDPESRNAMSERMAAEFSEKVKTLAANPGLRAVVLTGAGKAFSGGGHLEMLFEKTKLSKEENRKRMEEFYDHFLSLRLIPVPVIAAINGHAMGAGLCLALACDLRYAHCDAKLGLNFVSLGLHPGMGATFFLPRIVGRSRAAELFYLGKIISATEAARIGLVNGVLSDQSYADDITEFARAIAGAGPQAVRALKASLAHSSTQTLAECLAREAEAQADDYAGREFLEGITAAREKRKPEFRSGS